MFIGFTVQSRTEKKKFFMGKVEIEIFEIINIPSQCVTLEFSSSRLPGVSESVRPLGKYLVKFVKYLLMMTLFSLNMKPSNHMHWVRLFILNTGF